MLLRPCAFVLSLSAGQQGKQNNAGNKPYHNVRCSSPPLFVTFHSSFFIFHSSLSARRADLYPHIIDDTHTVRGIVAREKAVEITTVSTA